MKIGSDRNGRSKDIEQETVDNSNWKRKKNKIVEN